MKIATCLHGFSMEHCVICRHRAKTDARSVLLPIQTDIGTWARETFPNATKQSWVAHLRREVEELAASHAPEEAADCLILLLGHAHINGYDLLAAALAKMEVNRKRVWGKPDHEGVVEHVKPHKGAA